MAREAATVLIIEPFYGGSHQQLVDLLQEEIKQCIVYSLPAKKWHWRARTSALYFSQVIPPSEHYRVLFCSSVLNLVELVALRTDLASLKKVVYFHENQLVYPVRKQQDRDFQYGYNQVLTCLVADMVLFNSYYNKESFLTSIGSFMKLIPDHRPKGLAEKISGKCSVLYFPMKFPESINSRYKKDLLYTDDSSFREVSDTDECSEDHERDQPSHKSSRLSMEEKNSFETPLSLSSNTQRGAEYLTVSSGISSSDVIQPLVIVWPHRWEHDKNPELFFKVLYQLKAENCSFKLSVMGETFTDIPSIFSDAAVHLKDNILTWGYQETKSSYYEVLQQCDVVVSTAKHEFFGVAVIEAAYLGCYPLVPNDLVYPEIFPKECLYNTENQLFNKLRQFCQRPQLVRRKSVQVDFSKYTWQYLKKEYAKVLNVPVNGKKELK